MELINQMQYKMTYVLGMVPTEAGSKPFAGCCQQTLLGNPMDKRVWKAEARARLGYRGSQKPEPGSERRRRGREGVLPSTGAVCNARIDYGGALPSLIIRPPRTAV
ncbi:uncharacterized protein LOC123721023 isoform X2 [Papilio machaon]|uniref:uncharacterized protein LOC123721023 isoform X2 n=1 Tax=Papilio machaon TaxID=76193 RepID=UPI001E664A23|nr:uncharacterized protein LOC123721023 isoform X2 [Papilio machaon]